MTAMQASSPHQPGLSHQGWRDMGLLLLIWVALVGLTGPAGDFPLNDDWSFAQSVRVLLQTGEYTPAGWAAMPMISNVLWGSLFCAPGNCSYEILRVSTLCASLLGVLATHRLATELGAPRRWALLAALSLMVFPVFFALSFTFMTDSLALTLTVLAVLYLARYLRGERRLDLVLGQIFLLAAVMSRQLALGVAVAFALAYVWRRPWRPAVLLRGLGPLCLAGLALYLLQVWLEQTGKLPALYHQKNLELLRMLRHPLGALRLLLLNTTAVALYLGWVLLPLLLVTQAAAFGADLKRRWVFLVAGLCLVAALCGSFFVHFGYWPLMPTLRNVLGPAGIGPLTLFGYQNNSNAFVESLPQGLWLAITALAFVGATLGAAALLRAAHALSTPQARRVNPAHGFVALCAGIFLSPLLITSIFDRYLLTAIPLGAVLLAAGARSGLVSAPVSAPLPGLRPIAGVLLLFMAFFSVAGTRDYLQWNRLRWDLLVEAQHRFAVRPDEIDGGFEFNGMMGYRPDYKAQPGKSWWWVSDDRFVISFGPLPNYEVISQRRMVDWLSQQPRHLYLLRRRAE